MAIVLNDVVTPNNTSVVNANFQKIEDAINDDLLKREIEGGEANEMRTILDMNQNKQVNLMDGVDPQDAATVNQMDDNLALTTAQRVLAEDAASAANTSAGDATTQVGLAEAQVVIATTQAGISTAQAVISTTQAGLSAQSASDAQDIVDGLPTDFVETVVAGANITVDNTDPNNPIIASTGGGGSSPLTTKGDVYGFDTADQRLPIGTDGQVLTADSAEATGLSWADATGGGGSSESFLVREEVPVVLTAGEFTIDLTNFQDGDRVIMECHVRSVFASTSDNMDLEINGVTTGYSNQFMSAVNGASITGETSTARIATITGANATALSFSKVTIIMEDYSGSNLKEAAARFTSAREADNVYMGQVGLRTGQTAAVTTIKLKSDGGEDLTGRVLCYIEKLGTFPIVAGTVYSATEKVIGTWLGDTLYRKVIDCGALLDTAAKSVAHGVTTPNIKSLSGYAENGSGNVLPMPYTVSSGSHVSLHATATNVVITTQDDRTAYSAFIVVEYTKP